MILLSYKVAPLVSNVGIHFSGYPVPGVFTQIGTIGTSDFWPMVITGWVVKVAIPRGKK